ncbi:MAG TPA: threonine synthase [Actinomycetota bacterium]
MGSFVTSLSCPRCGRALDHRELHGLCPCGSPLLVEYDLESVARAASKEALSGHPPTMWRYREFLPVEDPGRVVSLGEGLTPLVPTPVLRRRFGLPRLWVKDDGLNPTGTFKARGAACGVARARELGVADVALATAGNAGGAWACYGAAAGVGVHVAMPRDAPPANLLECRLHGADVMLVDGLISEAGALIDGMAAERGWFDVSTLKEPYRIEGKKTLGLELAEQFGWTMPDAIVYPAGGGVGLIGIWRALDQLRRIGWLQGDTPRLIVTQSEGCAPLVNAFEEGREESESWPDGRTFAAGLRVPKARGDFLVLRAVRETGGTAVAVSDELIAEMMVELGRAGVAAAPEGAATLAAAVRLRERGELGPDDRIVLINTGTVYKYPDALELALGTEPPAQG